MSDQLVEVSDQLACSNDIEAITDINPKTMSDGEITETDISLEVYDLEHSKVGDYLYDRDLGTLKGLATYPRPLYVQLGSGNEVVVTTSIEDAIALHSVGIGSRTICPLDPDQLVDVCLFLRNSYPDLSFLILGRTGHAHVISITKKELNCSSKYPKPLYCSWDQFTSIEGVVDVESYIRSEDTESNLVEQFIVRERHVKNIENHKFIFPNLIVNQHIVIICAEPNAGKTTIMNWVCSQISELYQVRYLNMDCSGAELKEYQQYAHNHCFEFINFDITDTTIEDFFKNLKESVDLHQKVYVIDTLKKVVDPMKKGAMKEFASLLRQLCNKGATFILLAHTNKHRDSEGKPVFEGVGDVRADCDELIYLIPSDNPDGTKTVTTLPDKTRAKFEGIAFSIGPDRSVSLTGYIDPTIALQQLRDKSIISTVLNALNAGKTIQTEIVDACRAAGHGKNESIRALERYAEPNHGVWSRTKGNNNAWVYSSTPIQQQLASP